MALAVAGYDPTTQTSVRLHPRSVLFSGACLFAAFSTAFAQTAAQSAPAGSADSDETVKLPEFSVAATKGDRYAPGDALSAARIRASLADTAASISVVSLDFMRDIGAESVLDATRYSSGMSAGRAAGVGGILDRHVIRGFESIDGRVVDNFQTGFQANFDPQFIDRVEVVKGPNSILSPTGAPGGTINVMSKSPHFSPSNSLTLAVGQSDAQKISIDSTGPVPWLGKKLAYRVVADAQDTRSYLPGRVKLWDIETAFLWRISESTQLTFKYFGIDWTQEGAIGAANSWGIAVDPTLPAGSELYKTPPASLGFTAHGANGDTDWSTRKDRVNLLQAVLTTTFGDHISMRLAANWFNDKFGQDQGFQTVPELSASRFNTYTGEATPNYTWAKDATGTYVPTFSQLWDPTKISRRAAWIQALSQNLQFQNDFAGNFKVGSVSIQPVAGWSTVSAITFPNFDATHALPTANLLVSNADNPPKPDHSTYTYNFKRSSHNWTGQAYVYSRFGFLDDKLFITGGASRVWIDNLQYQWITNNAPANTIAALKDKHDTYSGGVLGKPLPNLSLYYSYSSNAAGVIANNKAVWRSGKQHEWGVKTDFFKQRLTFTMAHYQIIQTNLSTPNPAFNSDPVNNLPNILANFTNRGWEFETKGGLTKELSIVASYTTQQLRDPFGRRPRNIADRTAALLLSYHFLEGELKDLSLFAGVTRQGKTAGETVSGFTALGVTEMPGYYIPSFTIFNAGANYRWRNLGFNLTVDNLFDQKGFWQAAGRGAVPPIPERKLILTTTINF
jgi:iron complex outermembrane receptor protein